MCDRSHRAEGAPYANTIIRRPNCRKFCLDNDIFMEIHEKAWLIDIENFMRKVNPKSMSEHYEVPRLRNLRYCVNSWNKRYKRWQIDKHDIEYLIKTKRFLVSNTETDGC